MGRRNPALVAVVRESMVLTPPPITRRTAIAAAIRACAALSLGAVSEGLLAVPAHAARRRAPHPDPRPGVDASRMPASETVRRANAGAADAFDEARTIPEILDGIRCRCGCSDQEGMRSLLSCYEGEEAMALHCDICRGEARLAYRMKGKGRSLDEIRAAVDARYGG